MLSDSEYTEYKAVFEETIAQNERFLDRFTTMPPLAGKKVLEIGCGHGALCYELAKRGATEVVGVDLDAKRIAFANRYFPENDPALSKVLHFSERNIHDMEERSFDMVISKSTFEHVMDLEAMLKTIHRLLTPGGALYSGFGPLYNSFDGDHRLVTLVPWGHLLLSDEVRMRKFSKKTGDPIHTVEDMTFNMYSFRKYELIFEQSAFEIEYFKVNAGDNPVMKLFSALRFTPWLKELFSRNIYCVLRKKA